MSFRSLDDFSFFRSNIVTRHLTYTQVLSSRYQSTRELSVLSGAAAAPVAPAGGRSAPCRFGRYRRGEEPLGQLYKTALILETKTVPTDSQTDRQTAVDTSRDTSGATERTEPHLCTGAERADRPAVVDVACRLKRA